MPGARSPCNVPCAPSRRNGWDLGRARLPSRGQWGETASRRASGRWCRRRRSPESRGLFLHPAGAAGTFAPLRSFSVRSSRSGRCAAAVAGSLSTPARSRATGEAHRTTSLRGRDGEFTRCRTASRSSSVSGHRGLLACMHLGAALGALALPGSPWSTSIAWGLLALDAWRGLARHAFQRGAGAVVAIAHSDSEGWRLTTARGERIGGCTATSAFVHPWLCVVSWSTPRGRIDVLLPKGSITPDEARRLRVALRRVSVRSTAARGGARPSGSASFHRLTSLAVLYHQFREAMG